MEKNVLSLRITEAMQGWLTDMWETRAEGASQAIESLFYIYRATLSELQGQFTRNELCAILDVMNGTFIQAISLGYHVPANLSDGISLDGTAEKWGISRDLPARITAMPRAAVMVLELWCWWMWRHCHEPEGQWDAQIKLMAKPE